MNLPITPKARQNALLNRGEKFDRYAVSAPIGVVFAAAAFDNNGWRQPASHYRPDRRAVQVNKHRLDCDDIFSFARKSRTGLIYGEENCVAVPVPAFQVSPVIFYPATTPIGQSLAGFIILYRPPDCFLDA
jgi:hypothetical protein